MTSFTISIGHLAHQVQHIAKATETGIRTYSRCYTNGTKESIKFKQEGHIRDHPCRLCSYSSKNCAGNVWLQWMKQYLYPGKVWLQMYKLHQPKMFLQYFTSAQVGYRAGYKAIRLTTGYVAALTLLLLMRYGIMTYAATYMLIFYTSSLPRLGGTTCIQNRSISTII